MVRAGPIPGRAGQTTHVGPSRRNPAPATGTCCRSCTAMWQEFLLRCSNRFPSTARTWAASIPRAIRSNWASVKPGAKQVSMPSSRMQYVSGQQEKAKVRRGENHAGTEHPFGPGAWPMRCRPCLFRGCSRASSSRRQQIHRLSFYLPACASRFLGLVLGNERSGG